METVALIQLDPQARVFLMGDLCDWISVRDPRFDGSLLADWVDQADIVGSQMTKLNHLLGPLGDKVLGAIDGNHEHTIQREHSLRVKRQLCERFGWKDLSYSALVRLAFRRRPNDVTTLKLFMHHGFGGGRTMSDANHFTPFFASYDADWVVLGHTHKRYVGDSLYMSVDRQGELKSTRRLWGRSGTYLKTVMQGSDASYAERAGYAPQYTGCLSVTYYPDKQDWTCNF